jgi:hypothetical protein
LRKKAPSSPSDVGRAHFFLISPFSFAVEQVMMNYLQADAGRTPASFSGA